MKILLVRVSSLGDVLHNLPMVADILRHHPGATIDWAVEEGYTSLVRLNPHVRKIIPWALRRWRKSLGKAAQWADTRAEIKAFFRTLREEEYDVVFDTQGLLKTGVIMGAARVRKGGRKVGLANGSEGSGYEGISRIFHTDSIPLNPRTHAVARGRMVAGAALGYAVDHAPDFGLPAPEAGSRPDFLPLEDYAVFFHGTARDAKKWSRENWVELGHALAPMAVLLPWGSPQEKQEAEGLAASLPNARVLPRLSMMDAVALARHARLAVGVDTGLTHIAAAFVRPTVEIYCDSPKWKTEGNWSDRIVNLGDLGAPPSALDVIAAARRLLEAG
ncbi:lipopolysaccharide heptosyltransferase I [Massilia sp. BSC265]|uniref:lipopolysaccharide heptosyltransferase I n=1 Tax=Massilia sp. BSC265 TaxID=1549812 RepID=UPI0004E88CC3|nr:lipopolysaccharide heptosyltransferase I [Massilia sp. BSC265]KFI06263.1 ADP-heptose--LPS heptosyltransferase [Massilia sp. BSC265]